MVTRDEALGRAIDAAQTAQLSPNAALMRAKAMVSEAWIMIYDRLPMVELDPAVQAEHHPECKAGGMEHTGPCLDLGDAGDEAFVVAQCSHLVGAMLHRGHWLHVTDMAVCDDPPTKGARDDG